MKQFAAFFGYQRNNGFTKEFTAKHKEHAWQLAKQYEKQQNVGEPKSERIKLERVKEIVLQQNPTT